VRLSMLAGLRSAGFTLIELMIAIAIFAILIMLGMPTFTEYLGNTQIRNASEAILNGVRLAQGEAVKRNGEVSFVLDPATTGGWSVIPLDPDTEADQAAVQTYLWTEGSPKISVSRVPASGTRVTFTGLGRIRSDNPDASGPLSRIDVTNPTMSTPRPLRVVIGLAGTKLCDPDTAILAPDPMACP